MSIKLEQIVTPYNDSAIESISILKKKKEHILQQLQTFKFVWWGWLIASLAGAMFSLVFFSVQEEKSINSATLISRLIIGIFMGCFLYAYLIGFFRFNLIAKLRRIELELVKAGANELQENIDDNFFTKLVQINFKYIDQYYLQTQEQADKSFRLSAFAAISGLLIIIAGILMMYYGETEPAYVTTAAGILSEFIAAVFFYLYNRTILKMSQYHQKLVLTQNISLALKITDDMEKQQKEKSLELLIDRLTVDVNKYLTDTKS